MPELNKRIEVRMPAPLLARLDGTLKGVAGIDRSSLVRTLIEDYLGGIGTRRKPLKVAHEAAPDPTLRAIHIEDVREGVNLNQLARAANTGSLTREDVLLFATTEKRMRELFERRERRMAELGYGTLNGPSPTFDGGGA